MQIKVTEYIKPIEDELGLKVTNIYEIKSGYLFMLSPKSGEPNAMIGTSFPLINKYSGKAKMVSLYDIVDEYMLRKEVWHS